MDQAKRPPHNYEMESDILGLSMLNEECLITAMSKLHQKDFFHPVNRKIFEAIQDVFQAGNIPSQEAVIQYLMRSGELKSIGGANAITNCTMHVAPTLKTAEYIVGELIDLSNCRQIIKIGQELVEDGYKAKEKSRDIMSQGMGSLIEVSQREARKTSFTITEAMAASDEYFRKVEVGELPPLPKTGFTRLDEMMALHPGDVWVLGARTSQGKTAFAVNVALGICRNGGSVLFITNEMSPEQMSHRFASLTGKINTSAFRFGKIKRMIGMEQFSELQAIDKNLKIIAMYGGNELDLGLIIRQEMIQMPDVSLIIIDYIQNIEYSKNVTSNRIAVGRVSRAIKAISRQLGIRILLLSQFSRPLGAQRLKNPRPTMHDLYESGAIEQDADNVTLIWPQGNYEELKDWSEWEVKFLMEKSRNGATGTIDMIFMKEHGWFYESNYPTLGKY